MTGARIPCLNPTCRRTAPAEKYDGAEEIVCGKCWKLLPKRLTARYRALKRHERRLRRLVGKRVAKNAIAPETIEAIAARMAANMEKNWAEIRSYFIAPSKPVGLDAFMEEMGWR